MTAKALSVLLAAAMGGIMGCAKEEVAPAAPSPVTQATTIRCQGANSCKGQSACGGEKTSCAGQNACKNQGWLKLSPDDCKAKGGRPL